MKLLKGMFFDTHRAKMPIEFINLNPHAVDGEYCGCFIFRRGGDSTLRVFADSSDEWDHVSVSLVNRCPTWEEMEYVKRLFFKDTETAMQLHVPPADHINVHPYVLHLWRPKKVEIPMPPKEAI
jgi:hypothetical protein